MSAPPDKIKAISAELRIENLMKDSFKKQSQVSVSVEKTDNFYSGLPLWLQCESAAVPSVYKQLWSLVALTTELADTQKVSQILLTSGLSVDVLGFIWNLSNKVIPGQLTKQEFYIVLALVGLAQAGCTFNSLNVLKHIPVPSIPILQNPSFINSTLQTWIQQTPDIPSCNSFQQVANPVAQFHPMSQKNKRDTENSQNTCVTDVNLCNIKQTLSLNEDVASNLASSSINFISGGSSKANKTVNQKEELNKVEEASKNSNFPCIGSSPTSDLEDDFSEFQSVPIKIDETSGGRISSREGASTDDFSDFQSANLENLDPFQTVVVTQSRDIPKILLPKSFSEKLTQLKSNVVKISPESERKLKVLSTTESLSSLPESKISSTNKVSTSISVLGGNRGVGSRLANHSFCNKPEKEKCYKHQKHKAAPGYSVNSEEEIIFGVRPMYIENLMIKCNPKNPNHSKTFLLKETKIKNDDIVNLNEPSSKENTRQIEIPMLGTFNETVLPTQKKNLSCSYDLISVQEDKYSALREMDLVLNQENNHSNEKNDEFGDFLSANISPPESIRTDPSTLPASSVLSEDGAIKSWGEWNFNAEPKSELNICALENIVIDESKKCKSVSNKEVNLFDPFTSLSFSGKSECSKRVSPQNLVRQQDAFGPSESNRDSKSGDNDDIVKSDKSSPFLQPKLDQSSSQADSEFWDFLSTEFKVPVQVALTRQGSLPSLDLKISTMDETEQEVIWRKCLESCLNLMREGFEKFDGIRVKSVLDEVFSSPKTGNYLNCLYIVYQISRRVSQNFGDLPPVQEELEKLWGRLQELCFEYNIKLMPPEEELSEGRSQCSICLKYVACDFINQSTCSYHPSCANLWINFVEETLPFST